MNEIEKQKIALDVVRAVEKIAQSFGLSMATMPKQMIMMLSAVYVEGAKYAIMAVKKSEQEGHGSDQVLV